MFCGSNHCQEDFCEPCAALYLHGHVLGMTWIGLWEIIIWHLQHYGPALCHGLFWVISSVGTRAPTAFSNADAAIGLHLRMPALLWRTYCQSVITPRLENDNSKLEYPFCCDCAVVQGVFKTTLLGCGNLDLTHPETIETIHMFVPWF